MEHVPAAAHLTGVASASPTTSAQPSLSSSGAAMQVSPAPGQSSASLHAVVVEALQYFSAEEHEATH